MPYSSNNSDNSNKPPALATIQSLPKEARNLIAGGLAGMLAKSVVAPIDRIKILYQVTSAQFRLRDVPKVAYSITEKEGWAALWKGNTATMMRVFPYSGIQFMIFDYCKLHFLGEDERRTRNNATRMASTISHRGTIAKKETLPTNTAGEKKKAGLTPIESLVSGMIAGTISVLCIYPLDLARAQLAVLRKTKRQPTATTIPAAVNKGITMPITSTTKLDGQLGIGSSKKSTKGIGYVLRTSYQQGGARGLYRGITPTILGILPYSGVAFTINEQAKRQITHIMQRDPTTIERLQCGALSGLFAQTLAYPLEVTRRRMQTIGIVPTSGSESAAVNFTGVSQLKPSVDELPRGEEIQQQQQQPKQLKATQRLNVATAATQQPQLPQQHHHHYHKPPSMITTMQHLFEEQGIRGFYKGVSMNWVKGPIAFSISFTAFDTIQGWIETDLEREKKSMLSSSMARRSITRRLTNNEDSE
ncbi:hypothetical protein ACHAXR_005053 [Thalassiosira sp. AJA248-18]